MMKNEPCIFHSVITKEWPCRQTWKKKDEPNFQFLKESFGKYYFLFLYLIYLFFKNVN